MKIIYPYILRMTKHQEGFNLELSPVLYQHLNRETTRNVSGRLEALSNRVLQFWMEEKAKKEEVE